MINQKKVLIIFADFPPDKWKKHNVRKRIMHAIPVSQTLENNPEYENLLAKPRKWTL